MANMSYCRFENTASDLDDCLGAIEEAIENGMSLKEFHKSLSSDYERHAFRKLVSLCDKIQGAVEELECNEEESVVDEAE